jgi:four helix bundle protein
MLRSMQPSRRPSQPACSFRDLRVWQEARLLALDARPLCASLEHLRHWSLADQLRRAASSVHLNIAEGWGRRTPRDRKRFYTEAWASLQEVEAALIEIAFERRVPDMLIRQCMRRVHHVTTLLSAFRRASHRPGW